MAHVTWDMVPRLCVYSFRRESCLQTEMVFQYFRSMDVDGILACRGVEFYRVGIILCCILVHREIIPAESTTKDESD